MSLLNNSADLRHHSLQSYLLEQTEGQLAYRILQLSKHPQINTITQKVANVWKIFYSQTYKSAKQKKLLQLLNQKQIKSLKKLSILDFFQGKESVNINDVCLQLDVDKVALYRIITEMISKQMVSVKINDKNNVCYILAAKRRFTHIENKQKVLLQCQGRLNSILSANRQLVMSLQKTKN